MSAKISTSPSGAISTVIDSTKKAKNLKDYMLRGVDFEAASNGVIATCRFRLKPEVEARLSKASKGGYVDYDLKNHDEKMVFEGFDAGEVSEFLMQSMKQFQGSKAAAAGSED